MMTVSATALALVLAAASPAFAGDAAAVSNTAISVTGDISFDDFSIVFANGAELTFSELVADHFEVVSPP